MGSQSSSQLLISNELLIKQKKYPEFMMHNGKYLKISFKTFENKYIFPKDKNDNLTHCFLLNKYGGDYN